MNLKKNLLMILLMIVLTQMLSAQELSNNKKNLENELGIDLTRTYNGDEVNEIINIILEEADNTIDSAYKEGYKQATVELQPEIIYWKTLYETTQNNNKSELLKKNLIWNMIGFTTGCFLGGTAGFSIGINLNGK